MKHTLLILFFAFFQQVNAQTMEIKGRVVSENVPLDNAFVAIFLSDSVLLGSAFSDADGNFVALSPQVDSFYVKVEHEKIGTFTSAKQTNSGVLEINCIRSSEIDEVVITSQKPMIEKKQGAFIVNVDQILSAAGTSAFEVLALAPGVRISSTDNISLNGKDGVVVQINGKSLPMSGSDLANYLRGIPSSGIDKIECIHTPSSKYDAAGTAIINIVLKKDVRQGTNGTYAGTYGQGIYAKTSHTLSVNHRTKKAAFFASYGYSYRKGFNDLQLNRHFYSNDTFQGSYIQKNYFTFPVQNHSLRTSGDFTPNKKLTYGFSLNGVSNGHTRLGNNSSDVIDSSYSLASRFTTYSEVQDHWLNGSGNFYVKRSIDSIGSYVSIDLDGALFAHQSDQLFVTDYLLPNNQIYAPQYRLSGDLGGNLSIFSFKSDLVKEFSNFGTLEAGIKSSRVIADNDVTFYDASSGTPVVDTTKSNHFIYTENIHAAYTSIRKSWDKVDLQLGLRAELTDLTGNQVTTKQRTDTMYVQLFPTAFIGFHNSEKHQFELAIGRRIDRPSYDQLNPFKFYLDPSTYREGNPYLRPQTTYSADFTYLLQQNYVFTLSASVTERNITEVIAPLTDQQNLTVQTNVNLNRASVYSASFTAPIKVADWWNINLSTSAYVALYSGDVARTTISNQGSLVGDLSAISSFTAKKGWSFEWNGYYHTKEVYAFDSIQRITFTGIAVQKKFQDGKCILKMALTDVFFSNSIRANVAFTDYRESFIVKRDTRVATVSFTYKFGKASVQAGRRRTGGAEDLKGRVNTGAG
jgi:hypothetical protein